MSRIRLCLLALSLGAAPTVLLGGACDSLGTPDCTQGLQLVGGVCKKVVLDAGAEDAHHDGDAMAASDAANDAPVTVAGPSFTGVTSVSPAGQNGLLVTWSQAVDPTTEPSQMTYLLYVALTPGGEEFNVAHAVQVTGQTSTILSTYNGAPLVEGKTYYVVVGASNNAHVETLDRTVELFNEPLTDTTPPTFTSAVTAVPLTECQAQLSWTAAVGKHTASPGMHYEIYVADNDAGPTGSPSATTGYGVTSYVVPGPAQTTTPFHSYRVVAVDSLGNRSVDQPVGDTATNVVSFGASVQPVLSASCAPGCHTLNTTDKLSPIYDVGYAYDAIGAGDAGPVKANVCSPLSAHFCTLDAGACPDWQGPDAGPVDLVVPYAPGCSVLYEVLAQRFMPPTGAQPIDACDTALIGQWIEQGANP